MAGIMTRATLLAQGGVQVHKKLLQESLVGELTHQCRRQQASLPHHIF
jgi:hypothetical protein